MKELRYKIEGISSILFHNVNSMDLIKPKKMSHTEFENSEEMFKARLYLDEKEQLIIPERVLMGCLKTAAQRSGIKQDGKRATFSKLIRAVVFILQPMYLDQTIKNVEKFKEYVTIQNSKVLRIFPGLKKWGGKINILIDETQIPEESFDEIFKYGASFCGLGDYRPMFGRFRIIKIN